MKKTIPYIVVALLVVFGSIAQSTKIKTAEYTPPKQQQPDPVINLRLTLPQLSNTVYALRNSTLLDAQTGNGLADLLITQANDTILNKDFIKAQQSVPKQK